MVQRCPNCQKSFKHVGRYDSTRRALEILRRRYRTLMATTVGTLAILFAIYTAPGNGLNPEPNRALSIPELEKLAKDDSCPICAGKGKVDCKVCIDGRIFYPGNSVEDRRCSGKGWLSCLTCKGTGTLREALATASP